MSDPEGQHLVGTLVAHGGNFPVHKPQVVKVVAVGGIWGIGGYTEGCGIDGRDAVAGEQGLEFLQGCCTVAFKGCGVGIEAELPEDKQVVGHTISIMGMWMAGCVFCICILPYAG